MPSPRPSRELPPVKPAWDEVDARTARAAGGQRAVPNYQGTLNLGAVMRELEGLLTPDAIVTTRRRQFRHLAARVS